MTSSTRRPVLTAALALMLSLGACSTATETADSPPVTETADSPPATGSGQTSHNSMDTQFAQQMIVHHEGAVEMAAMAQEKAVTPDVQDLAGQIEAAQGPEIEVMRAWLQEWDEPAAPEGDTGGMDHGDMGGAAMEMDGLTQQEAMSELESLSGTEFDRRFLELMIEHHRGAVMMAQTAQSDGQDPQAQDLAEQVVQDQEAEIERMEQLLENL